MHIEAHAHLLHPVRARGLIGSAGACAPSMRAQKEGAGHETIHVYVGSRNARHLSHKTREEKRAKFRI